MERSARLGNARGILPGGTRPRRAHRLKGKEGCSSEGNQEQPSCSIQMSIYERTEPSTSLYTDHEPRSLTAPQGSGSAG